MDDIHFVYENLESLIFLTASGCACTVQMGDILGISKTLTVHAEPK